MMGKSADDNVDVSINSDEKQIDEMDEMYDDLIDG
jgi:hypothetical protein